ncbi:MULTISPECIES: serine/threonine-protein kinase [unclassified Pseudomonas]|uniref:serine/threonine-protein kinase n=1 Tax=unclassified Pseudomonas TaxID=196821 RepID=UPI00244C6F1A|nr:MULTISPECIES: serine/threonine-protein kinase [unclassified Pseudomonas]MDH0892772.1 protein kinase [Pseudomonas sp. GD03875]MDH1063568.1 protein kinase [Pseudomonas sp. GD03985]
MATTLLEIPGYRVHGQLGKGGMAEIFLATQESLSRKVAIKVLRRAEDEAFSQRFVREAHMVASLNHPSIITIHDIDRLADGRHYLAMEFLPGGDLARHKGELFAPERALEIARQIASGLAVVHDKGMVHRDVKPANVLFRADGTAVLTDFGVAKDLDIDSELTQFGVAVGSPAYSSPEQAQCQPLDARSDIYSLGVILLEMLTGSNPFRGGNYTQTVVNHVQMEPPLPDSLGAFRGVLARMLTKSPDQRFADCRALLAALDEVELSDLEQTQIRPAAPIAVAPAPRRRRSAMPLLVTLSVLVLIGTLTFAGLYLKERRELQALLDEAEQRFASGHLVEPEGDSAEHYFNRVLALDEQNGEALNGLLRIRESRIGALLVQADQRLAEGLLTEPAEDNADFYYRQALAIDPQHAGALEGLQRLLAARIARSLALAEQSIADKRLLLPEGDSAVHYFRQVLGWSPDNAEALAGLNRVALRYRELAGSAYRRSDFPGALAMIERGLEAEPQNTELLRMRGEHQRLLDEARVASTRAAATKVERERDSNPIKRVWNNLFGQ